MNRRATVERETGETRVRVQLDLDGAGEVAVSTGLGFLDHVLTSMAFHADWDLRLEAEGDLEVDDHHTAEDCALALGQALDQALGERAAIARFGWAYAPLDEALARAVVDLSGRPWPQAELGLEREAIGQVAAENLGHVIVSLAVAVRAAIHVDVLRGSNDHHRAEAAFKALGMALHQAVARNGRAVVPSTKGVLA